MAGLTTIDEALKVIERLQFELQQTQVGPSQSFPQVYARSLGSRGQEPQTPHPQVRNPPVEPFFSNLSSLRSAHESRAPHLLSLQTRQTRWPSLTKFSSAMGQVEEPKIPHDQHFRSRISPQSSSESVRSFVRQIEGPQSQQIQGGSPQWPSTADGTPFSPPAQTPPSQPSPESIPSSSIQGEEGGKPYHPQAQNLPNQPLAPRDNGYAQPRTLQTQRAQNGPSQSPSQPANAIVIKNIHAEVTRETLTQIMSDLALPLPHAFNYHFDRVYPHKFRGLAFANFSNETEATRVLEAMDRLQIFGKLLRVEYKKELPPDERAERYRKKQEERREQERTQADQALVSDLTDRLIREASVDTIHQMQRGLYAGMHQEGLTIIEQGVDPVYLFFRNQAENILRQGNQVREAKEAMSGSRLEGIGSRAKPQCAQAPPEHVASPHTSFSLKNVSRRRTTTDPDLIARAGGKHSFTDKNWGF
jgi:RNA recognition motif-containing protein